MAEKQSTSDYWEARYAAGGNSGKGSGGVFAEFKAEIVNTFVREHDIASVIDFGCGDGAQLALAEYAKYIGLDTSKTAVEMCRDRFKDDRTKTFLHSEGVCAITGDLGLSMDVVYHLIEDEEFERYMRQLFLAATKFVIIYSTNIDTENIGSHSKHRQFTTWIETNLPAWKLIETIPNKYQRKRVADFFIYAKE